MNSRMRQPRQSHNGLPRVTAPAYLPSAPNHHGCQTIHLMVSGNLHSRISVDNMHSTDTYFSTYSIVQPFLFRDLTCLALDSDPILGPVRGLRAIRSDSLRSTGALTRLEMLLSEVTRATRPRPRPRGIKFPIRYCCLSGRVVRPSH